MFKGTIVAPTFVGVIVKEAPLHIVAVWAGIVGFGFTVTVTVKGVPEQLLVIGVTV